MSTVKNAALSVGLALLMIAVVVGLYLGGWWITKDSTDRQTSIDFRSTARQTALVDEITRKYAEVSNPNLPQPQKLAIINLICADASQLTGKAPLSLAVQNFINQECN